MDADFSNKKLRILNIDGAVGIKGLIPLFFCDLLEKLTGNKIYELFDFFSGTSIGAIISLCFSQRIFTAGKLLKTFLGQLKYKIFANKTYHSKIFFRESIYKPELIEEVWKEIFGHLEWNKSKGNFLITGTLLDKSLCEPCIFVNYEGKKRAMKITFNREEQDFFKFEELPIVPEELKIWQLARITSAAFPVFSKFGVNGFEFLDGAISYNNPSFLVIKYLKDIADFDINSVFMLSLGTTEDRPNQKIAIDSLHKNIKNLGSELISSLNGMIDNLGNNTYQTLLLTDTYLHQNHVRITPINNEDLSLEAPDNNIIFFLHKNARHMIYDLKRLSPVACKELGIFSYETLNGLTRQSRFHYYPRYHRYRECYVELDEVLNTNLFDNYEICSELERFNYPEDVKETQKIIILKEPLEMKLKKYLGCNSRSSSLSDISLALAVGHLGLIKLLKKSVEDIFQFKEFEIWTLFHIAAANNELAGILILIESEYLEPDSLNKYSDFCYCLHFRKDLSVEKLLKLVGVFLNHKNKSYSEEEAKKNDTPLGLAVRHNAYHVIKFFKRCRDKLNQRLFIENDSTENLMVFKNT